MKDLTFAQRNFARAGGLFFIGAMSGGGKELNAGKTDVVEIGTKSVVSGAGFVAGGFASFGFAKGFGKYLPKTNWSNWASTDLQSTIYVSTPWSFISTAVTSQYFKDKTDQEKEIKVMQEKDFNGTH